MSDSRYFVLKDEHGVDHADNLEPIQEFGLAVGVPTMVPGPDNVELVEVPHVMRIQQAPKLTDELRARVIPDTRYVETNDPLIAGAIVGTKLFDEVDEPNKGAIDKAHKETQAHVEAMKTRDKQVAAGEIPAPDVNDVVTPDPAADGQEG